MSIFNSPEQDSAADNAVEQDPLARFRTWRGFLLAAIVLNALFVYGMFAAVSDPGVSAWVKALSWLPFNGIASVLYYVFMVRLTRDASSQASGWFYQVICIAAIVANWAALFAA